jgi:hypothetical protein
LVFSSSGFADDFKETLEGGACPAAEDRKMSDPARLELGAQADQTVKQFISVHHAKLPHFASENHGHGQTGTVHFGRAATARRNLFATALDNRSFYVLCVSRGGI